MSVHLSEWSHPPDFTGLLWQTQFFTSQLILGFRIGQLVTFVEKWGLLLGCLFELGTVLDPRWGVPLARNSWIGLLAWLPSKMQL